MDTTKAKDPSGPAAQAPGNTPSLQRDPRRTLLDRLRENLEMAEQMDVDFPDLHYVLPSSGRPVTLDFIARRLGVDLCSSSRRDVLLYGLVKHCKIFSLRRVDDGVWMFARRPRLLPPRPPTDKPAGDPAPAPRDPTDPA